jgi:hypothetical protein
MGKRREEVAIKALNLSADHYICEHDNPEALCAELTACPRKAMERWNVTKMLRESEEKYRNPVENSKDSIVTAAAKELRRVKCSSAEAYEESDEAFESWTGHTRIVSLSKLDGNNKRNH